MRTHHGRVLALALVLALAGCTPTPKGTDTAASVEPSVPSVASASPSEQAETFPTAAFADIREDPVSEEAAAEFPAALIEIGNQRVSQGHLPSLAGATAGGAAGAMASDSASVARWLSRLCGGEIVSEASVTAMTTFPGGDTYGLGLSDESELHGTPAVGRGGIQVGFAAWAMCFVEDGSVVVVLTNRASPGDDAGDLEVTTEVADALAVAARSD